jgi:hypothetical protein
MRQASARQLKTLRAKGKLLMRKTRGVKWGTKRGSYQRRPIKMTQTEGT